MIMKTISLISENFRRRTNKKTSEYKRFLKLTNTTYFSRFSNCQTPLFYKFFHRTPESILLWCFWLVLIQLDSEYKGKIYEMVDNCGAVLLIGRDILDCYHIFEIIIFSLFNYSLNKTITTISKKMLQSSNLNNNNNIYM